MTRNGAQLVWESLVHEGIDVVSGIPGGSVIPLYHLLCDYPIRLVLMRHEQAVVHAADGYARVTGWVGVCRVTSWPGATKLVTGLATIPLARGYELVHVTSPQFPSNSHPSGSSPSSVEPTSTLSLPTNLLDLTD